jgi:hypothetical protein
MQQNYGRAFTEYVIYDLGVAAADLPTGDTMHQRI